MTRLDEASGMKHHHAVRPIQQPSSAFAGFRFPPEVILLAVRWYLRYGLSYRDLEELLAERGTEVDHVTLFRWVQRFTPILADAAGPCRHAVSNRWFVDETYVKVSGVWRYVYRAVDVQGQVIDVLVSKKRDTKAATRFFARAIDVHGTPTEVTTDRAPALAEPSPSSYRRRSMTPPSTPTTESRPITAAWKARLRPMRGLKRDGTASVVMRGHAFIQNLRRGHYELGVHARPGLVLAAAFDELAPVV
jgi:IS6 family transposase